jgi:CDP-diacylglycerol--glycerol-3-phosphate 3-phosphatidyltransferase
VILSASPPHPALFAILPVWLLARMGCATIDGTLAIEFGQKSRLGGILNEVGDIVSDIALFLPLAFVPPFSVAAIVTIAFLIALAELAGIAGAIFGSDRRLEGPLGKADRSIVLALIGMAVVVFGELPPSATVVLPVFSAGLIATAWNRFCCAGVLGYRAVVTPQRPEPRHTP